MSGLEKKIHNCVTILCYNVVMWDSRLYDLQGSCCNEKEYLVKHHSILCTSNTLRLLSEGSSGAQGYYWL